jgi:hypothetical protein
MKTIIAILTGLFLACQASALAGESPDYLQSFNPTNGFKPAQGNLTQIFLQLAGSLEFYGSPEPYLRHVKSEHKRIEAKYQQESGKLPKSFCPAYMTDEYLNRLATNWNLLSPKLDLKPFAQDIGHLMRLAVKGTRDSGTIVVEIFNEHQSRVLENMTRAGDKTANFDLLKSNLVVRLEFGQTNVNEEKYEIPRRDAVSYAIIIHGTTMKLFKRLDDGLKPADAERVKAALTSVFMDVGRSAESELEAAISEWAFDREAAKK